MKRIFIAINLPAEIKSQLGKLEKEIEALFPEEVSGTVFKWVKSEILHLTLLFIGEIKEEKLQDIIEIARQSVADIKPFNIKFKKVCYGSARKVPPRLIWLEIERNDLLNQISGKLGNFNFSPHITLARIRTWQWKQIDPEEQPDIEKEINLETSVDSIDIMESVLKRSAPEYVILQKILLHGN